MSWSQNSGYHSHSHQSSNSGFASEKRRSSAPAGNNKSKGRGNNSHGSVAGASRSEEKEVVLDGHRLLKKHFEIMNTDSRRFVWWKEGGQTYNAGHVVFRETQGHRRLIKTILNTYEIRLESSILDEPPADITTENAENIIEQFQTASINFETIATIERKQKTYYVRNPTVREDIVVSKFAFSKYENNMKIAVYDANRNYFWVDSETLRCQAIDSVHQDTLGFEQQITDLEAQVADLTSKKRSLEQSKRDLQHKAKRTENDLDDLNTKLEIAKAQAKAEKRKQKNHTKEVRDLKNERTDLQTRLDGQRKQISVSDRRIRKLEIDLSDCTQRIDSNEATIRLWSEKHRGVEREKFALQQDLFEKMRVIDDLREKEAQLQTMDTLVRTTAQQNDELRNQNGKLQSKQAKFLGLLSTTADYWSVNLVNDLISLRRNQHDSAFEEVCEDKLGLDEAQSYHLLWRVFMFAYEYCENRMNQIRTLLRLDQNEELANMFITRLQEAYAKTFDMDGLEKAFLAEYAPKFEEGIQEEAMIEYVRSCGKLCWCVVLSSSPKVEFRPRVDDVIDSDKYVEFDSNKFCPFSSLPMSGGEYRVVQYVLPGLYRVDSELAASNNAGPCVRVKEVEQRRRVDRKVKPATPRVVSATMTKKVEVEEASLESELWDGNIEPVKRMLAKQGINLKWKTVVIGCAQCDFEFVQSLDEYEQLVKDGAILECGEDEDHEGARVVRSRSRWSN